LARVSETRFAREKLSDTLLGFFLGGINGYLIVGSIWYFMIQAGYPFEQITAPQPPPNIVNYLPPELLIANNSPIIYFAVAIGFLFVLVVFI
jgi:hypothetical protein